MGAVMSGYLETPVTEKEAQDGISKLGLKYGGSSMQGWRVANEDAMSCVPDLTDNSALFAVYDGHGGAEVALYVAKYLPMLLKTQYDFTDGKIGQALKTTFLAVDKQIVLEETADELQTLAGTKADDEDEEGMEDKIKECEELNEEAQIPLVDLLAKYKQKFKECMEEEMAEKEGNFEGSGKGKKAKVEVPDILQDDGEPAAAGAGSAANGEEKTVVAKNGKKDAKAEGSSPSSKENGTTKEAGAANGDKAKNGDDEEDSDYEEEEEAELTDEDDSGEEGSEEGSSDEDSDDDDPPPEFDEREGYGSGTTACVAVIKDGVITVANVGDSRCVVCTKDGKAVDLSEDHKPESDIEKARVEKAGGKITKDGRVNGGLNLSRALGDHQYKQNTEIAPEEQMISPMPDVETHTIAETDEFMLIACDGIWNVLTSDAAISFIREQIAEAKAGDKCSKTWLSDIAGQLMEKCMAPDTSGDGTGCDNMTVLIVLLNQDMSKDFQKRKLESEEAPKPKKSKTS